MTSRTNSVMIVCLIVISGFIGFITFESGTVCAGSIIYVGSGLGNQSATINGGIMLAQPGDTVFVYSGIYNENVAIDRTINLTGENKSTTIIDGNSNTHTLMIISEWVNVSGFTITGGNPFGVFIQLGSNNNTIEDNIIYGNDNSGVEIYWYSNYNTIANNTIKDNSLAGVVIHSKCDHNVVADNFINNHSFESIMVTNPFGGNPNSNNKIKNNIINNSETGIYLYNANSENIIKNNTVNNSDFGISLYLLNTNNTINRNTIINSSVCGMFLMDLNENNRIYHNNFVNNAFSAFDNGSNIWNLTYPEGGNFWDDYSGGDNRSGPQQDIYGNDAFGDAGYAIAGGTNTDSYPLWPNWDALEYYKPSPGELSVCEYAIGTVKVAVIFVESNGSIDAESENWSQSRQSTVISEIQDALTWWEAQEGNASLNLSIEVMGRRNTSYEPITRPSEDDELWISEIMDNMGFSASFFLQQVMNFNHWMREQYNTDWAYTIFVVDSYNDTDGSFLDAMSAYSYWTGACIVMTYDNNGYGIANMNRIAAHETGHMFYATDEYQNPGETSGYLNATEVDDSGCLMDDNTLVLSSGTRLQVGWRDTDSDGIMDILGTEPNTYLEPYEPDPTYIATPVYTGYAVVVPYPNDNPNGFGRDVTLNTILNVQFRIDNGTWKNATSADGDFDEAIETFQFTVPKLSPGTHFIETRSVNSVNNSDPTYANDTITILGDNKPPGIEETTSEIPVTGNLFNITANATDNVEVDTVWLEFNITSENGYWKFFNVQMNGSEENSFWYEISIWDNTTWFNYSIKANDTSDNWNITSMRVLNFKVHNLDTGEDFIKIQHAIDDSDTLNGHTIYVDSGIYYENVVVEKSINLIGENRNDTIIDGGGSGDVVNVNVNWVNVSGFTVRNSGNLGFPDYDAGIDVRSDNNTISSNNLSNNENGIFLGVSAFTNITDNIVFNNTYGIIIRSSSNNSISNCNVSYNYQGIILFEFSKGINITKNTVLKNTNQGIVLYLCSYGEVSANTVSLNEHGIWIGMSDHITVINNTIAYNNNTGVTLYADSNNITVINNDISNNLDGIVLSSSEDNILINNNLTENNQDGIYFWSSSNNDITDNIISDNINGIRLTSTSDNNTITGNTISQNIDYGFTLLSPSINNEIYHNNFINNTFQAYDQTTNKNQWDNGYPSGGNFWSDYRGNDFFSGPDQDILGNDGIGDTNHSFDKDSVDNYPLMFPSGDLIFLYPGWNLISIPFIQSDTNLSSILKPIEVSWDTIWRYNSSDSQDLWKLNNTSKPQIMNDMDDMNHTMGIWIHITDPDGVLFQYPGIQPTQNQKIELRPGWNLVGFPSLTRKDRISALGTLTFGNEVDSIWTYNAATQRWDEIGSPDYFEVGRGYWIHAKTKCVWEVPL